MPIEGIQVKANYLRIRQEVQKQKYLAFKAFNMFLYLFAQPSQIYPIYFFLSDV
jgi:hypothetical protein